MTDLRADCGRCAGLCCVAPAFAASSDFAVDKPAGQPCANLAADFRCGIHADLRERGFAGCTVFDCFGAGQQVTQVTFAGRDWRSDPTAAEPMFASFAVMRQLHELLWYLADALARDEARPVHADLRRARDRTSQLTRSTSDELAALDLDAHRQEVDVLLRRTSELVRAATHPTDLTSRAAIDRDGGRVGLRLEPDRAPGRRARPSTANARRAKRRGAALAAAGPGRDDVHPVDVHGSDLHTVDVHGSDLHTVDLHGSDLRKIELRGADLRRVELRGADLAGKDLSGADLRGASLRGACLIGADLSGADLRTADVIGADLRGADLSGADITDALFLTRFQVNAASGDHATRLPTTLERPPHWPRS